MSSWHPQPRRGEVWMVNFDPTVGSEIGKQRPAVVISSDAVGKLPVKLVAPITGWQEKFAGNLWHVQILPTATNGLTKESAIDALQVRSVSVDRFGRRLGRVLDAELEEVVHALAAVVELT
ncbi:MAG: type II toxin-antitoxin system PemK/MazF family toxin [Limisphaerales bacterium]